MKVLRRTNKVGNGRGSHYHVVYQNDETGTGVVAPANKHVHSVAFDAGAPASVDEMGNPIPERPAGWVVGPADDGHTHTLEDYAAEIKMPEEADGEIVNNIHGLLRTARELEKKSVEKGIEAEKFYAGEQWDESKRRELEELGRAALTINLVERGIDRLSGHQRQQRTDVRYTPTESGDGRAADLMTILVKKLCSNCNYEMEESKIFTDLAIVRGAFNLWVDFSRNVEGDIKIERFPWDEVSFGPHEKEDLEDCEYLIKRKWYSIAKLKQLYRKKAEEIGKDFQDYAESAVSGKSDVVYSYDNYRKGEGNWLPTIVSDIPLVDIAKKEYLVLECQQKVYVDAALIIQPDDGFVFRAIGWEPKDIEALKQMPEFFNVIETSVPKIRITRVCGRTVLFDQNPADLPYDDFYLVPAYAKKRKMSFWSKVESAKDPQRELNKRRSQIMDVANKSIASGVYYDASTFADDSEKEKFKKTGTSPGFMVQLQSVDHPPREVTPPEFPVALVNLMQIDTQNLEALMDVTAEPTGANQSGAHYLQQQKQTLITNEFLFDNFSFAKKKVFKLVLHLIRKYYTPERIMRIVNSAKQPAGPQMPMPMQGGQMPMGAEGQMPPAGAPNMAGMGSPMVGDKPLDQYSEEEILEILRTQDITECDVTVAESNYSPSYRLGVASILLEMMNAGMQIPPDAPFRFVDMPESERQGILASIAQQAQAQAETEGSKNKTEVTKTLIAQGIIPPAVREEYQLDQATTTPAAAKPADQAMLAG